MTASTARLVPVAAVVDVAPGAMRAASLDGRPVVVAHVEGRFSVVDATCTHAGGPLGEGRMVGDCRVQCPWHGATFDLRTGAPDGGPARKAVHCYDVRVEDGRVLVLVDGA